METSTSTSTSPSTPPRKSISRLNRDQLTDARELERPPLQYGFQYVREIMKTLFDKERVPFLTLDALIKPLTIQLLAKTDTEDNTPFSCDIDKHLSSLGLKQYTVYKDFLEQVIKWLNTFYNSEENASPLGDTERNYIVGCMCQQAIIIAQQKEIHISFDVHGVNGLTSGFTDREFRMLKLNTQENGQLPQRMSFYNKGNNVSNKEVLKRLKQLPYRPYVHTPPAKPKVGGSNSNNHKRGREEARHPSGGSTKSGSNKKRDRRDIFSLQTKDNQTTNPYT